MGNGLLLMESPFKTLNLNRLMAGVRNPGLSIKV